MDTEVTSPQYKVCTFYMPNFNSTLLKILEYGQNILINQARIPKKATYSLKIRYGII